MSSVLVVWNGFIYKNCGTVMITVIATTRKRVIVDKDVMMMRVMMMLMMDVNDNDSLGRGGGCSVFFLK